MGSKMRYIGPFLHRLFKRMRTVYESKPVVVDLSEDIHKSLPRYVTRVLTGLYEVYFGKELEPVDEGRYGSGNLYRRPTQEEIEFESGLEKLSDEPVDSMGRAIISEKRLRFRLWKLFNSPEPKILYGDSLDMIHFYYQGKVISSIVVNERPYSDVFPITALKRNEEGKWHVDYKPKYPRTLRDVVEDLSGRIHPELTPKEIGISNN